MAAVSLSSFWIHDLRIWGPWSPIHLLSIFTLVMLPVAVWAAHRHRGDRVHGDAQVAPGHGQAAGQTDHRLKDEDIVSHLVELVEKRAAEIEAEKAQLEHAAE